MKRHGDGDELEAQLRSGACDREAAATGKDVELGAQVGDRLALGRGGGVGHSAFVHCGAGW